MNNTQFFHLGIYSLIGQEQYYNNVLVLFMVDGP